MFLQLHWALHSLTLGKSCWDNQSLADCGIVLIRLWGTTIWVVTVQDLVQFICKCPTKSNSAVHTLDLSLHRLYAQLTVQYERVASYVIPNLPLLPVCFLLLSFHISTQSLFLQTHKCIVMFDQFWNISHMIAHSSSFNNAKWTVWRCVLTLLCYSVLHLQWRWLQNNSYSD